MMAGEIQEPFSLSLLENSIHSGSVSFGRFEKEALSWEKRSSFSHNRYLEEAEKFSKPGSVTLMRAHFEAHFKKNGIRFPTSVQAQTWGDVVHHQTDPEKDENLWESTSQFGDSCVSYEEILVNSYDDHSFALDKIEIGCNDMTTRSKPLENVKKASPYSTETKASTKKHVALTKEAPSRNTTTSIIDTKRQKELKPKRVVKTIASQAPATKKTESLTLLATNKHRSKSCIDSATRQKRTTTNGSSFRSSELEEKRKEEKVETVARKALNVKARPMPKITQAKPQHTSTGQAKVRDDPQKDSSKASCDRSLANGTAKGKLIINKQRADILQRSLNGIRPKTSDQTARNNPNRRSLAFRHSAVEVAL